MSRLRDLARHYPLPTWRPLAWLVMGTLSILGVWANFAQLDEVTTATGEVVPEGRVKTIQHLEGGIVREIYVRDGEEVRPGTPLMLLDLPVSAVNKDELLVRLDGLLLTRSRLTAQANGTPLTFPEEEAKRRPQVMEAERKTYDSQIRELQASLAVLNEQSRQRVQEIQENEAKQRALAGSLKLARQKLKMADDLASAGLMAKMEHVTQESDVETLQGQLNTIGPTVPRLQSALAEVKERTREENAKFSRAAQAQLPEIEVNIARTRELLSQANDQALRTQITSPSEGVIKNMRQNTIGGVVRSGEPIMEIVPLRERLMIEARLSPADRGYVAAGQDALVKVTAYDFARYGGLNGQVVSVAPDTMTGPDNQPYYRMVILTHRGWLGTPERKLPITPGMQAMVDVHTGTRTVLEYLLKPVLKIRYEAFRER